MALIVQILNGTNQCRDAGFQAQQSAILNEGVRKNFLNELEVTTNQLDTGMCFIEVTRDAVTPNEVFLIPVFVTVATVIDTTGDGYIILRIDKDKVNDGSANAADGSGIATVEKVATLVGITDDYFVLATLASGVITDAREWAQISENVLDDPIYYDEDLGGSDSYVITINGLKEYKDGQQYRFKANTNNTGVATLNINSLGAKSIRKDYDSALVDGDIEAGQIVVVIYDADNDWFQMQSPLANSPTVLVKASQAEAEAGADDDHYMTSLKTFQAIIANLHRPSFRAGENLAIDDSCILINDFCQPSWEGSQLQEFGKTGANTENYAISFTPRQTVTSSQVKMYLAKFDAVADNVIMEIRTDSAGDPTGAVITNGTSNAVTGSGLPDSSVSPIKGATLQTFTFASAFTLTAGTTYWIKLKRSGATSNTVYYKVGVSVANYAGFLGKTYNGSSWATSSAAYFEIVLATGSPSIQAWKTDSDHPGLSRWDGFATATVSAGVTVSLNKAPYMALSSLTLVNGSEYWPSDTAGAISTSKGTYGQRIGYARSSTILEKDQSFCAGGIVQALATTRTITVAHNLGKKPRKINVVCKAPTGGNITGHSDGFSIDGQSGMASYGADSTVAELGTTDSSNIVRIVTATATDKFVGNISRIDEFVFDMTISVAAVPANLIWVAEA